MCISARSFTSGKSVELPALLFGKVASSVVVRARPSCPIILQSRVITFSSSFERRPYGRIWVSNMRARADQTSSDRSLCTQRCSRTHAEQRKIDASASQQGNRNRDVCGWYGWVEAAGADTAAGYRRANPDRYAHRPNEIFSRDPERSGTVAGASRDAPAAVRCWLPSC